MHMYAQAPFDCDRISSAACFAALQTLISLQDSMKSVFWSRCDQAFHVLSIIM